MKNTIPIRVRMLVFASVMLSLQSVDVCQALPAQTADASAASGEQLGDSKPDTTTSTDNDSKAVQSLIAGLGAKSFEVRAEASKQLKTLPNEQIRRMSELAAGQASAEVIVRILAEVDNRYSNGDTKQQELASETLEALISAERILLAELAESSLQQHAAKRIQLAQEALTRSGAIVRDGSFMGNMFPGMPGGTPRSLQVMFTDEWTGGDEGLKIFGRLSALFAVENLQASGVTVYLIDGHPITEQQEAKLAEWVGHTRLVRRGAVALGIVGDARIIGGGVLIGEVSPGGTADRGGLRGGDLLLAMEPAKQPTPKVAESDKPSVNPSNDAPAKNKLTPEVPDSEVPDSEVLAIEDVKGDEDAPVIVELDDLSPDRYLSGDKRRLRDFDDLVERLKGYKIDDEITLHVIRGYERYRMNLMFGGRRFNIPDDGAPPDRGALKVELVKVKLKGWKDVQVLQ